MIRKGILQFTIIFIIISACITSDAAAFAENCGIIAQDNIPKDVTASANTAYAAVPEKIRDELAKRNSIPVITTDKRLLGETVGMTYLYGTHDNKNNAVWTGKADIYIAGYSTLQIDITLNHEIGHWADAYVGEIRNLPGAPADNALTDLSSATVDFRKIMDEEMPVCGYTAYNKSSASEYYAESFALYFCKPDYLQKNMPKTYEYIKSDMETIMKQ